MMAIYFVCRLLSSGLREEEPQEEGLRVFQLPHNFHQQSQPRHQGINETRIQIQERRGSNFLIQD